jgi:hypothetical protein
VRYIFGDVVNHRLILDRDVHKGKATVEAVSKEILNSVAIPKVRDAHR